VILVCAMVIRRISEIASGEGTRRNVEEDCLECRLVGGSGLAGLGLFILYQARQYVADCRKQSQPPSSPKLIIGRGIGFALIGLGFARFAGMTLPQDEKDAKS